LGPPEERSFAVSFWDGSLDCAGAAAEPRCTILLKRPGALRRMLLPPSELAIGEAYLRDDFDVAGDLEAAAELADLISDRTRSPITLARLVPLLLSLPADDLSPEHVRLDRVAARGAGETHSPGRDAQVVLFHYDAGNDFYRLWLDEQMVYSCAYFTEADQDLNTAQANKLEHICRKLRLRPGERLLDIGCGWGGLVRYAAAHYGVEALGITLSEPQAALARERIRAAGLADRCRVEVCDYRALPPGAVFDKAVSVGMVEHVGKGRLAAYFGEVSRHLRLGGLFLNHGIVLGALDPLNGPLSWVALRLWRDGAFVQRYVFPDGELVKPARMIREAERAGFETRDVENLREHYVLTLRHWVRRLESHREAAVQAAEETVYRIWRLYMAVSAHAFCSGRLAIIQTLLSKPGPDGASGMPLTRADLYAPQKSALTQDERAFGAKAPGGCWA
ncbi:MAG TPA: cyclopropane-fatty-acyl-phospholipid synthase family protein, partial [Steroidobacteraceae bacterium]|nr:cyclopropane-fatty-acyl-phospholipid synthase family protein [Steroidobacteraceae bacterium]